MRRLSFRKLETFQTPDGETYVVHPMPVKDMKRLLKYHELVDDKNKALNKKNSHEAIKIILEDISQHTEQIVDEFILNEKTGKPIPPGEYKTLALLLEYVSLIEEATTGFTSPPSEGDDTPLEQEKTSSNSSEEVSISSKKKPENKQKKS